MPINGEERKEDRHLRILFEEAGECTKRGRQMASFHDLISHPFRFVRREREKERIISERDQYLTPHPLPFFLHLLQNTRTCRACARAAAAPPPSKPNLGEAAAAATKSAFQNGDQAVIWFAPAARCPPGLPTAMTATRVSVLASSQFFWQKMSAVAR